MPETRKKAAKTRLATNVPDLPEKQSRAKRKTNELVCKECHKPFENKTKLQTHQKNCPSREAVVPEKDYNKLRKQFEQLQKKFHRLEQKIQEKEENVATNTEEQTEETGQNSDEYQNDWQETGHFSGHQEHPTPHEAAQSYWENTADYHGPTEMDSRYLAGHENIIEGDYGETMTEESGGYGDTISDSAEVMTDGATEAEYYIEDQQFIEESEEPPMGDDNEHFYSRNSDTANDEYHENYLTNLPAANTEHENVDEAHSPSVNQDLEKPIDSISSTGSIKRFQCKECGVKSDYKRNLIRHLKIVHDVREPTQDKMRVLIEVIKEKKAKQFDTHARSPGSSSQLVNIEKEENPCNALHKTVEQTLITTRSEQTAEDNAKGAESRQPKKIGQCQHCSATFKTNFALKRHMKISHEEAHNAIDQHAIKEELLLDQWMVFDSSGKDSAKAGAQTKFDGGHEGKETKTPTSHPHVGEKERDCGAQRYSNKCVYCFKTFERKSELFDHLIAVCRKKNLGQKQLHQCPKCDKSFMDRLSLKSHIRGHKGVSKDSQATESLEMQAEKNSNDQFDQPLEVTEDEGPTETELNHNETDASEPSEELSEEPSDESSSVQLPTATGPAPPGESDQQIETDTSDMLTQEEVSSFQENPDKVISTNDNQQSQCYICGDIFSKSFLLNRHLSTIHSNLKDIFRCDHCPNKYSDLKSLKFHKRQSHPKEDRPFKCDICQKGFKERAFLKTHRMRHTGERPYQCVECGKTYRQSGDLRIHSFSHKTERTVPCRYCPKMFKAHHYRYIHETQTHGQLECECERCGTIFRSKMKWRRHQIRCKGDRKLPKITNPEEALLYECKQCCKAFKTEEEVVEHAKTHEVSEIEGRSNPSAESEDGEKAAQSRSSNDQRGAATATDMENSTSLPVQPSSSVVNSETHDNAQEMTFLCPTCARQFATKEEMEEHEKLHLSGSLMDEEVTSTTPNIFGETCKLCFKQLKNKKSLQCHMYRHALSGTNVTGESAVPKSFSATVQDETVTCKICSKKLKNKKSLECHMYRHGVAADGAGEKRVIMKTTSASVVENNEREQEQTCPICSKKLRNKKSLECHMWRHSSGKNNTYDSTLPFKCAKCRKRFKTREEVLECVRAHKGIRQEEQITTLPFKCAKCRMRFKTREEVMECVRAHKGIRQEEQIASHPHTCPLCSSVHVNKTALQHHLSRHKYRNLKADDHTVFSFACALCKQKFNTKVEMMDHSANSIENNYSCIQLTRR